MTSPEAAHHESIGGEAVRTAHDDIRGFAPPPAFGGRALVTLTTLGIFTALSWADATGFAGLRSGWWLMPVAILITVAGIVELRILFEHAGLRLPGGLLAAGATLMLLAATARSVDGPAAHMAASSMAFTGLMVALCIDAIVRYRPGERSLDRLAAGCLTALVFCLPMAFIVGLRYVSPADESTGRQSILPLASMVAVVKAGDIAAYLVGSSIGRRPMAPLLSPQKTWEGAAASIATSIAISGMTVGLFSPHGRQPLGGWIVYGLFVGFAGLAGDLTESLLKRELRVKDSGRLLASLGGVLDLVDALLLAAPVAWFLWVAGGS